MDRHKDVKAFIMQRFVFLSVGCVLSEYFQVIRMTFRLQRCCYKAFAALMPASSIGLMDNRGYRSSGRASLFTVFLIFFLVSCATHDKYSGPGYVVASWYGPEFHGKPTSSGEIFDMHAFTCAHREYPFGTILKITNGATDKTVRCVVNDRGPFVSGRDIDLSYAAANEIGLVGKGTSTVRIDYMGRDDSYIKKVRSLSDRGPFTIQVGSFREVDNSARLKTALELKYGEVYIAEKEIGGQRYYRVRIGSFQKKSDAYRLAKTLADEGYSILVVGYEGKR